MLTGLDGLFRPLVAQPADELLQLIGLHAADPRPDRIDLGVGVYRTSDGDTPVLRAVKEAERETLGTQRSKGYLGTRGNADFLSALGRLIFDQRHLTPALVGIQTPGGSGALRLAAELIASARPSATFLLGTPTWPNHHPIFARAGLRVDTFPQVDITRQALLFDRVMAKVDAADAGDVLLLHACCHNPTGIDLSAVQWRELVAGMDARGVVPLIDCAYHGLARGLERDVEGFALCLDALPEVMIAYSCNKNFGLYRERTGALWIKAASPATAEIVLANCLSLARTNWSMPPDHGAEVVRVILDNDDLRHDWEVELATMRDRLRTVRQGVAERVPALDGLARGTGMFATLPLPREAVEALRVDHGIYMAGSGRINVAGLNEGNLDRFAAAVAPRLEA